MYGHIGSGVCRQNGVIIIIIIIIIINHHHRRGCSLAVLVFAGEGWVSVLGGGGAVAGGGGCDTGKFIGL